MLEIVDYPENLRAKIATFFIERLIKIVVKALGSDQNGHEQSIMTQFHKDLDSSHEKLIGRHGNYQEMSKLALRESDCTREKSSRIVGQSKENDKCQKGQWKFRKIIPVI